MNIEHFFQQVACVFILINCTCAFLPNQFSPQARTSDYTHADITQEGIVKAVAEFFETIPAPGKTPVTPDTLTGIANITTRKLYDVYYGSTTTDIPFQNAIDNIIKYNNEVDQQHYNEAVWHCNGEQMTEANQLLIQLRANILNVLKASAPAYETARRFIGQFFHVMQMFYSNTNWINLHNNQIYQDFGISGKTLMAVATADKDVCNSCGSGQGLSNCSTLANPFVTHATTYLTSGYKSGQDIQKPYKDPQASNTGKCSHGGSSDKSGTTSAAVGGINKETSDSAYSPQYHLHKSAAQQAINHTTYFLIDSVNGIASKIGNNKFIELLQLQPSSSLVFVLDTTYLMGSELAAIKTKTNDIIQATQGTVNEPYNYILVTFNDPGSLTETKRTNDSTQMTTWLNAISPNDAHPHNDCPEFSLTGLSAASAIASYNSDIYVFTDAAPKDPAKLNFILSLMTERRLKINFFVTGECTRRKKRSVSRRSAKRSEMLEKVDASQLIRKVLRRYV